MKHLTVLSKHRLMHYMLINVNEVYYEHILFLCVMEIK